MYTAPSQPVTDIRRYRFEKCALPIRPGLGCRRGGRPRRPHKGRGPTRPVGVGNRTRTPTPRPYASPAAQGGEIRPDCREWFVLRHAPDRGRWIGPGGVNAATPRRRWVAVRGDVVETMSGCSAPAGHRRLRPDVLCRQGSHSRGLSFRGSGAGNRFADCEARPEVAHQGGVRCPT